MSQDFNLAKVFADLANDPSWPWTSSKYADPQRRFTIARLALRLVDEIACNLESNETAALEYEGINPDHYANVKKRVEEAKSA